MKKNLLLLLFCATVILPQASKNFIYLSVPERDTTFTSSDSYRLSGSTLKEASLFLNDAPVHVYDSGAFAGLLSIKDDTTVYRLTSISGNDTIVRKLFFIKRKTAKKPFADARIILESIPLIGKTNSIRTAMNYGLGSNRLGGAKMQFIGKDIYVNIDAKSGDKYRVLLAPGKHAWIPENEINLLSRQAPVKSLTGRILVEGDDKYDYVSVNLSARLPYAAFTQISPTKIFVDIYGATSNTNWLVNRNTTKEIKSVDYLQVSDDIFRIIIEPEHPQLWGYSVYYEGNILFIKVRRKPENLDIEDLTFVIDAGHGGKNNGALGSTGLFEKDVNLAIAKLLRDILIDEGAEVFLTREDDSFSDNKDRLLSALKLEPDMLISVHSNSIGLTSDPRKTKGTAAFYKDIEYRKLAEIIHENVLETGLEPYGFVGKFNFTLNSAADFPSVLVETAFISNPEDEMKLMDAEFRELIAEKIFEGIEDYLDYCEDN